MINEEDKDGKLLGTFVYDQDREPVQTFEVQVREWIRKNNNNTKKKKESQTATVLTCLFLNRSHLMNN